MRANPNQLLAEFRAAVAESEHLAEEFNSDDDKEHSATEYQRYDDQMTALYQRAIEAMDALDGYLSHGGHPPDEWLR
ncbi:hypothetical protein [Nocardia iowensis]|uniref:Uncharacterized protein n=1 Tax=Nocardia iowensis TaxID=204891 RepID=A0ABX8RW66_NOCIO|nr:hypothetical protein [Nocardia iowensis]QXN92585.1 hypothetical protein KV110_05430 [Nocardia iowensis]